MAGQVPSPHPLPQPDKSGTAAGEPPRREKRNLKGVSSMKAIQSIKAIQYRAYGAYAENRFVDLPAPAANDGQVLVRMHTVGINPLDNTFRSGHHYAATPENLPRIGGQIGAGIVVETKSPSFKVGGRVFVPGPGFGVIADGTWRELVAAPAAGLMPIPSHIDDDHAAAFLAGGLSDRVSRADGVCCLQTRAKRACSRYRRRGGYGECADCAPARRIARDFHRQHQRESGE